MNLTILRNPAQQLGFTSKRDLYAHYEDTFNSVVREYIHTRQLSPVVAHQIDPDPITCSEKLTALGIEFCCDVEKATEIALAGRLDLQAAWFEMAAGHHVTRTLAHEVIMKCGRLYAARKLAPWLYFRRDKYAHRRAAA